MSFSILVATPTIPFGDLIRNSLEESGRYTVQVVHTTLEAHESLPRAATTGSSFWTATWKITGCAAWPRILNANQPDVKLVLIPPDNDPRHPIMDGLKCNAYLRKPFYLPDLIELMDELVADGFERARRRRTRDELVGRRRPGRLDRRRGRSRGAGVAG